MKNIFTTLLTLLVLSHAQLLRGEIIQSSHLQINEGLQQSTIYSIYQDEFGIIWFGTKNGLVRFDGNRTEYMDKLFQDIPLSESLIRYISGDKKGKIYLSTRSEVISYDIRTNTFTPIMNEPAVIHYGTDGLWICRKNRIDKWENDSLQRYITLPKEEVVIECLAETPQKELYLGTKEHGIYLIRKNGKIENYFPQFGQVKQLLPDSEQNLWIATRRGGIYKMNSEGNLTNLSSLTNNIVRGICEDNNGNLWVATFNGLNKYIRKENRFVQCDFLNENFSLNDNSIYCLFKDSQGTIWTGSYMGEINYFDPDYEIFKYHFNTNRNKLHPNRNVVFGKMVADNRNNLWICAERNGLFQYDKAEDRLTSYPLKDELNIQTAYLDKERNVLWVGTLLQGLTKIDLNTNAQQSFGMNNTSIREIIPYKGRLLLGTLAGIFLFNPADETYVMLESQTHTLSDRPVICMALDKKEVLWIAFDNRLVKYSLPTNECETVNLNPGNYNDVNRVFESSKGDIWIGTKRHGLYRIGADGSAPVNYNKSGGLASNLIIDIAEDENGNMLLATGNGLSYLNEGNGQFINIEREKFLPKFTLSENCLFIGTLDKVFIGGANAICELSIGNLLTLSKDYMINFSNIAINGERLEVTPGKGVLKESLFYCGNLVLPHHANSINVEVFTNNYSSIVNNGIHYKLEGLDKEWKEANSLNEITYTSLSPGRYTLHVRGDIPLSDGNYPEKKLEIRVKAPFYQSNVAYGVYVLLMGLLLYAIYQFVVLRSSLRWEKAQKKYIEELNQSKLRFFTNVSHEFKTPLTLINCQVENLLNAKSLPPKLHGRLLSIWKNTTRMNRLISELMEFRKQEQGFLRIKVSEYNIVGLVKDIVLSFKDYAQSRKIVLNMETDRDEIVFYFDVHQLEKAVFNILSNAFKFTPDGGNISIRMEEQKEQVLIHVSDTGIGIDATEQKRIFDRFYQAEDAGFTNSTGTGIGLAFTRNIIEAHRGSVSVASAKGKGSTFTLSLPTDIIYKPEEMEGIVSPLKDTEQNTGQFYGQDYGQEQRYTQEQCYGQGQLNLPDEAFFEEIKEQQEKHNTRNSTILIIEDDEEVRELLEQIFSPLYRVITAANGLDGYEKALSQSPDIILSDIVMPEMSGIELCKRLKTNMEISHIPIVLLTSQSASEYVIEGLKTGADDYITKPFSSKQLIVRCHNLVNNRKALQKRFTHEISRDSTELIATTDIDQSIIENSIRIVHENLDNPLFSIDFIAQSLGIGRTKYFAKIKAITGLTPNEFVINTKLKYAVRLLNENRQLTTNELSESLGFGSTSYFIKLFKEFTGVTPKEYAAKRGA